MYKLLLTVLSMMILHTLSAQSIVYSYMMEKPDFMLRAQKISEFTVLDTSFMNITYEVRSRNAASGSDALLEDRYTLGVGAKYSVFHSDNIRRLDSLSAAKPMRLHLVDTPNTYTIIRDNLSGEMEVINRVPYLTDIYLYNDRAEIKWKLTEETDSILGYRCSKATASFRGREYTVCRV